jgi:hypothetical protein
LQEGGINLRVFNALGAQLDQKDNLLSGSEVRIGEKYSSGLYLLVVTQGAERILYKLIKN